MIHDPRTCENSQPCHDCYQVERIDAFLYRNKTTLTRQYLEYVESMIDDEQYDEMEPFFDWIAEELKLAQEYARRGQSLDDYILT